MPRHLGRAWAPALVHHCASLCADAIRDTLAFLAPVVCAGCGDPGRSVCSDCRATLISGILTRSLDGVTVYSAAPYTGRVKRLVLALKRDGRVDAGSALGSALRGAVDAALDQARGGEIEFVTVPASRRSRRSRGFVPVALLARHAGFGRSRVLTWVRRPRDQIGLRRDQRRENLTGAMTAPRAAGRRFIVVDDVVTTGATLAECVRALRTSGGEVIACATIASTPMRAATPGRRQSVTSSEARATVYEKA